MVEMGRLRGECDETKARLETVNGLEDVRSGRMQPRGQTEEMNGWIKQRGEEEKSIPRQRHDLVKALQEKKI